MTAHQAPPSLGFSRQEHRSGLPFPSPMNESEKWKSSCSVVSDSSRPHGPQPTRLLHPWDFPGKSTGVFSPFLKSRSKNFWPRLNKILLTLPIIFSYRGTLCYRERVVKHLYLTFTLYVFITISSELKICLSNLWKRTFA